MARLFPREYPSDGEYSEQQLYEAATSLDDGWVVVHSVQYFAHRDNRTTDGEADFILLHREHGGICVEVKGASRVEIDGWYVDHVRSKRYLRLEEVTGSPSR